MLKLHDWTRASIAAVALLGIAITVLFRIGLEEREESAALVLAFGLLPGWGVYILASVLGIKSHAATVGTVLWLLVLAVSYLWYFGLSYGAIKVYRRARGLFKS